MPSGKKVMHSLSELSELDPDAFKQKRDAGRIKKGLLVRGKTKAKAPKAEPAKPVEEAPTIEVVSVDTVSPLEGEIEILDTPMNTVTETAAVEYDEEAASATPDPVEELEFAVAYINRVAEAASLDTETEMAKAVSVVTTVWDYIENTGMDATGVDEMLTQAGYTAEDLRSGFVAMTNALAANSISPPNEFLVFQGIYDSLELGSVEEQVLPDRFIEDDEAEQAEEEQTPSTTADAEIPVDEVSEDAAVIEEEIVLDDDAAVSSNVPAVIPTDEEPIEFADEPVGDEAAVRAQLIDELLQYDDGEKRDELREVYKLMPTQNLQVQLSILQADWGGGVATRATLQAVQELIEQAKASRLTKSRHSLLEQKYVEYHRLAQQISNLLGNDTVINGLRHREYHQHLKDIIDVNAMLGAAIREMANMIAYRQPDDTDDATLVPQNTDELVRICLSVGVSARSWVVGFNEARKRITQLDAERAMIVEQLKQTHLALNNAREMHTAYLEEQRKQQHSRFGMKYVIVNHDGEFLSLDAGVETINPKVLTFDDKLESALLLNSEEKIRKVFDALRRWVRKDSKFHKLMIRKGLHPAGLSVCRLNLTRI